MQAGKAVAKHRLLLGGSDYSKTFGLDVTLLYYLWTTGTQSPLIQNIIDFVALWATTSSWSVEITSRNSQGHVFSDDNLNKLFEMQCRNKLETIVQHILIFGFVAVSYTIRDGVARDQVTGTDIVLNILHPYEYEPRYKYSKRGNKKWIAFTRASMFMQVQTPIPHSRIFIFREPEVMTMRPTSALMSTLRSVFQYEQAMALQEVVAHKRAFPVWVYKSEIDKLLFPTTNPTMPGTNPAGADDDIGLNEVDVQYLRDMNVRQAMQNISASVHQKAMQRDEMVMQMYSLPDRSRDAVDDFVAKAAETPTMPSKLMAPGIALDTNVPEAKSAENFADVESLLKTQICASLGVPIELIFPQSGRTFAADANLSRKVMDIRTTRLHQWLGEILQEIFLDIHIADMHKTVDSIVKQLVAAKTDGLSNKIDRDTLTRAGIMLKDQYRNAILQDIIVSVHFAESTSASLEDLLTLYKSGVIDHEKFQQLALARDGIPQSAKATISKEKRKELDDFFRFGATKESKALAQKQLETPATSEPKTMKRKPTEPESEAKRTKQK